MLNTHTHTQVHITPPTQQMSVQLVWVNPVESLVINTHHLSTCVWEFHY